jgi:hypothetical protein
LPVSHLFISNHHNLPFHVLHYTTLAAAITTLIYCERWEPSQPIFLGINCRVCDVLLSWML